MPIDKIIKDALTSVSEKYDLPVDVSKRIGRWLDDIADAKTDLNNVDDAGKRIDSILDKVPFSDTVDDLEEDEA